MLSGEAEGNSGTQRTEMNFEEGFLGEEGLHSEPVAGHLPT